MDQARQLNLSGPGEITFGASSASTIVIGRNRAVVINNGEGERVFLNGELFAPDDPTEEMFGSGLDGDYTVPNQPVGFEDPRFLQEDMHYQNLTIPAGCTLYPNGCRIFVRGTLMLGGTIDGNGNSAVGKTRGNVAQQIVLGSGGGGFEGAAPGFAGEDPAEGATRPSSLGGSGGAGGGSAGGPGGNGAEALLPDDEEGGAGLVNDILLMRAGRTINKNRLLGGGGGGSGAGGTGGAEAGAGGGGGGGGRVIMIAAANVTGSGLIQALGGAGGDGEENLADNCRGGGGGGGGGGGVIILLYRTLNGFDLDDQLTVQGGIPGIGGASANGQDPGENGTIGANGRKIIIQI